MSNGPVDVGIVGLGRWATVLTQAASRSKKLSIVSGHSRSVEKRAAFTQQFGIACVDDVRDILANPNIQGIILTVPNEQHLPVAELAAAAGKQVYVEKPIANTLESGLKIADLQERYDVQVMVGYSARLLKGTQLIRETIDAGERGKIAFMDANFSNERASELMPDSRGWYLGSVDIRKN